MIRVECFASTWPGPPINTASIFRFQSPSTGLVLVPEGGSGTGFRTLQYGVGGGSDARHGVAMGERAHNVAIISPEQLVELRTT